MSKKRHAHATKTYRATLVYEVEVAAVNAAQALRCLRLIRLVPPGLSGAYMVGDHTYCHYCFKSYRNPPTIKMALLGEGE